MQSSSVMFRDALNVSHRKATAITVVTPDGMTRDLRWASATVSSSGSTGVRYSASVEVIPEPGIDLYSIVSTPGAVFTITHGIDFGAGAIELLPLGVYEAASGGIDIVDGTIGMSLTDQWARLERCRFSQPYSPSLETFPAPTYNRAELIEQVVVAAMPDAVVEIRNTGGSTDLTDRVWETDRTQFIKDIATDGELDAYFDAAGVFVIRTQPIIDQAASVWTFRTGEVGNIMTASRERPFDRLYNRVVVKPVDDTQTWERQVVDITDPDHPRHADKIGVVPYFFGSPTILTAAGALSAANTILQRVQGTTETLSINALGAPLEVGDTVTVAHQATPSDPGFGAVHILDEWTYDLATGLMTASTRSNTLVDSEETV